VTLAIPTSDAAEYAGLPLEVRNNVRRWLRILTPVFNPPQGCRCKIGDALRRVARDMDVSDATARRLYDIYRQGGYKGAPNKKGHGKRTWFDAGDWRVFINRSVAPQECKGVPPEIIECFRGYCESDQRKNRSAWRRMIRDWRAGKLPHLPWPEVDPVVDYPIGCSYRNLVKHAPTRYELTAARIGRTAADAERPLVYTTRKGLWVGSHIMFDDMWHDFFVNTFAEKQAGRPLELFSHDLFSARKIRWGVRVRTRKADGSMSGLEERMTRYVLAATLFLDGYSPRGTIMVVEHGTAAFNDRVREALAQHCERDAAGSPLITVSDSGMKGAAAHAGQYPGLSRGNFRHKASLESSNNLTHNEFAHLPAQTGMDLAHRPEGLEAQLKHNQMLLWAREQLRPATAAKLEFDLLELNEFMHIAGELYTNIEQYTDHELSDWIDCGHVVNEMLIGKHWVDRGALLSMTDAQRQVVHMLIESGEILTRPRKMSRREVWDMGAADLIKFPAWGVCDILGPDLAVERKVVKNQFEFQDAEVGPGMHRYSGMATDADGHPVALRDGETYQAFVNPFAPDTLFVCNARGGYIGQCRRINAPCRADVEAVQRACGAAAKREGELLAPVRARHLAEAREMARRASSNADALGESQDPDGDEAAAVGAAIRQSTPSIVSTPSTEEEIEIRHI
jgi:hypothetical protein